MMKDKVRWELYPRVADLDLGRTWLQLQANLQLAPKTIEAYGRGLNDYLAFCERQAVIPEAITREQVGRSWYPILRDFELQPGDHQAKIVVREPATGRIGSVIHEFTVPPLEGFRVSTPVITDLFYQKAEGGEVVPKFLAHREFPTGSALLCKFDVFGAALDDEGMPRVAQGYEVRGPDGRVYAEVAETVIKPTSLGALTRLVAFPLRDATPGEYEIRLRFEDELGGERLELREPFTVVAAPAGESEAPPVASTSGR